MDTRTHRLCLFRLIDIFKPLGCRKIEGLVPGGWGVMLDDVLAGFYALVIVGGHEDVDLQRISAVYHIKLSVDTDRLPQASVTVMTTVC